MSGSNIPKPYEDKLYPAVSSSLEKYISELNSILATQDVESFIIGVVVKETDDKIEHFKRDVIMIYLDGPDDIRLTGLSEMIKLEVMNTCNGKEDN